MITVFTPTYNRLDLLKRLYGSLLAQTDKSFEWVVVDDASDDGTDAWIETISKGAPFKVVYKKNPHGGKHRAINTGVGLAAGDWFFIVDSDDMLPENSLETISGWIADAAQESDNGSSGDGGVFGVGSRTCRSSGYRHSDDSKDNMKGNIAGVAGLVTDMSGRVVGEQPDIDIGDYIECGNLQRYRSRLMGDKAEIFRTDILKRYPFPEIPGEDFITERVVWDQIAHDGYVLRWYRAPIYTCEYQETGLSNGGANSVRGHLKNYRGYLLYVSQSVRFMEAGEAVTVFREYDRTARIRGKLIHKKAGGHRLKDRAADIGFSAPRYLYWLLIKMPVVYAGRLAHRLVRR